MPQGLKSPPWQSMAQEAAIWRSAFDEGKTRQVGETERFGRRALVLESVRGKWTTDEPDQTTTMVVDAESFSLYGIRTVLHKQGFGQDISVDGFETLERAGNEHLLAMSPHPGAKRVKGSKARSAKKKSKTTRKSRKARKRTRGARQRR
jgi:hypothetical protein